MAGAMLLHDRLFLTPFLAGVWFYCLLANADFHRTLVQLGTALKRGARSKRGLVPAQDVPGMDVAARRLRGG